MDKYYGNVCELDIIFNFQKAYFILDELLLAGEMQESSKKNVLRCISQQDSLEDMEVSRCISYLCRVYEMFFDLIIGTGNMDATAFSIDLSDQTSIGLVVFPCCSSAAFYYPLETAPAPQPLNAFP
ncbi:clathrin adaptor complex small chain-domain-containing protein [Aspergillus insuetus]